LWYKQFLKQASAAVTGSYEATLLAFLVRFSTRESMSDLRQAFNQLRIEEGESVLSFVDKLRHRAAWISASEDEVEALFKIACREAGMGETLALGSMDRKSVWEMARFLDNAENSRAPPPTTVTGASERGRRTRSAGAQEANKKKVKNEMMAPRALREGRTSRK
jgi:hypothetical protein